ncbi:MAG: hypothetical protein AAGH92_13900 [Planctomycetota bacterium]
MRYGRPIVIGLAYAVGTVSGVSKQLEAPGLVSIFEQAGIPPELLSLLGAAEFVLALALLFARTRKAAALCLAGVFAVSAYLLWPVGPSPALFASLMAAPLVLLAGFWRDAFGVKQPPYLGAIPLGISKPRR